MNHKNRLYIYIIVITIILSGCSFNKPKMDKILTVDNGSSFFSAKQVDIVIPVSSEYTIKQMDICASAIIGNTIVVACVLSYKYSAELEKKINYYTSISTDDFNESEWKQIVEETKKYTWQGLIFYDYSGNVTSMVETNEEDVFYSLWEGNNNELLALGVFNRSTRLVRISLNGTIDTLISFGSAFFDEASRVVLLQDGSYFISGISEYGVWDKDGKQVFKNPADGFRSILFEENGHWYITSFEHDDDYSHFATYIQEIDIHTGQVSISKKYVDERTVCIAARGDDGYYGVTERGVEKLHPLKNETEPILLWENTDVNYAQISQDSFTILSSNELCFLCEKKIPNRETGRSEKQLALVILSREESNPYTGKPILVVGMIGECATESFIDCVVKYNTSPASQSRIVIRDLSSNQAINYMNQLSSEAQITDQIYLDMKNGLGPDILLNFNSYCQFNTETVVCDLNTYIDGKNGIDTDDFFDNVFQSSELHGKLYHIPINFVLDGVLINEEYFGDQTGWTYDDFYQKVASLPTDVSCMPQYEYKELLIYLLSGTMKTFVDYDEKTVRFDCQEFISLVDLVKNFGVETKHEEQYGTLDRLGSGILAMTNLSLRRIDDYVEYTSIGNAHLGFAGWPTNTESGPCVLPTMTLAISSYSAHKDEAWDFIKSLLDLDPQYLFSYEINTPGIPVSRDAANLLCEEARQRSQSNYEFYEQHKDEYYESNWSIPQLIDQDSIDEYIRTIESANTSYTTDPFIMDIVLEEVQYYFMNQKSIEDVCSNIQNRAKVYVQER